MRADIHESGCHPTLLILMAVRNFERLAIAIGCHEAQHTIKDSRWS